MSYLLESVPTPVSVDNKKLTKKPALNKKRNPIIKDTDKLNESVSFGLMFASIWRLSV